MKKDLPQQHLLTELGPEVHEATAKLLGDVLAYLRRLPPHPMTTALANRVQAHFDNPTGAIIRDLEAQLVAARQAERVERIGSNRYTPAGLPVLTVALAGARIRVSSPAAAEYGKSAYGRQFAAALVQELAKGVEIDLKEPFILPPASPKPADD